MEHVYILVHYISMAVCRFLSTHLCLSEGKKSLSARLEISEQHRISAQLRLVSRRGVGFAAWSQFATSVRQHRTVRQRDLLYPDSVRRTQRRVIPRVHSVPPQLDTYWRVGTLR